MKKVLLLLSLFCGVHHIALAQSNVKDSLYRHLQKPQADTTKVLLLLEIADVCPKDSINYYKEKALAIALQTNYAKGLGRCYFRINTGKEGEETLNGLRKAVPYSQKSFDWSNLTEIFNGIGIYYRLKGNYDSALFYHQKALDLALKYKDTKNLARCYTNKGVIYRTQGNYQKAIENYYLGLQMDEKAGDLKGMSINYNNIGNIYYNQGEYQKAKSYYEKSITLKEKAKDLKGLSLTLANLASCLYELKQTALAIEKAEKGLAIAEKNKFQNNIAVASAILAEMYIDEKKDFVKSLAYLERGMKAIEETKSNDKISQFQGLFAHYYNAKGEFQQAYEWADKGQALSEKIGNTENAMQAHYEKSIAAEKLGKYDAAYQSHRRYIFWKDSIENEKNLKNALSKEFAYKEEKSKIEQEKKELEHEQQLKQQRYFSYTILGALAFMLVIATVIYRSRQKEKKSKELLAKQNDEILQQQNEIAHKNNELSQVNEELFQQQEELVMLNENLEAQKREVEETYAKLKETSDTLGKSIAYASHIQGIILADTKRLQAFFNDLFIIYRPKDVVSGDFYWFSQINDQEAIFVLADCTGHGVPGAFMSMLGSTLLHETINVKGISNEPARILKNLHSALRKILKQDESRNTDGMDISLCYFQKQATGTKISFAGAKTAMYYVENQQFMTIQGDRIYLGGKNPSVEFQNKEAFVSPNSVFYFTSDGFGDQNNAARQKFGSKILQDLLFTIHHLPLAEQKSILESRLQAHQGAEAQRDDISVVGLFI